jgi:hypothetical protein
MEEEEARKILFARFLYSWLIIFIAFFLLWMTNMINTKLYGILTIVTTIIMVMWLVKIING